MSSKAEWLFLMALFVIAIVTTLVFPPSRGIEGSQSAIVVEVAELSSATSD